MEIVCKIIAHDSDAYREAIALRYRILREPLGLNYTAAQLASEAGDTHFAALLDGQLIGCLLLTRIDETTVQMRQVAIEALCQGQGVGRQLVAFAETYAAVQGYRTVILHARETAVPFYVRLGYELYGDPYVEITLPHQNMRKTLPKSK